jgi:uncharacterized spore protein YtfJ
MGCDDRNVRSRPFSVETVKGEPYHVGGRKLTPVTRIVSFAKASATVGTDRISGQGGGFVRAMPVAMLEEIDEGVREIAIYDATAATLHRLAFVVLATTFLFAAIRWWARRRRKARSD